MEELKILIDMVSDLPEMAIWVLVLFFIYKVVIVGSIFGVIKSAIKSIEFGMQRWHEVKTFPEHKKVVVDATTKIDRLTISGEFDFLIDQLDRLVGMATNIDTPYIHNQDIIWLRDAISEKIQREKGKES